MKRVLLLLSFLLSVLVSSAYNSGTCGENLIWTYEKSTRTLTISGSGEMKDFDFNGYSWGGNRSYISSVIIDSGVTSIGSYAFLKCTQLMSIIIPDGVTSIGEHAFHGCSALGSIDIPNSVTSIGEYNQEIKGKTNVDIIPVSA